MSNCRRIIDGVDQDDSVQMCCPYENSYHLHHYHPIVRLNLSHFHFHYAHVARTMELQLHHHINLHLQHNLLPEKFNKNIHNFNGMNFYRSSFEMCVVKIKKNVCDLKFIIIKEFGFTNLHLCKILVNII